MANQSILAAFQRMWEHVVLALSGKADTVHTHDEYINTTEYTEHTENTGIHVTANEKTAWDAKAEEDHEHDNYVPTTRTINGKALNEDINLTAEDIGIVDDGPDTIVVTCERGEPMDGVANTDYLINVSMTPEEMVEAINAHQNIIVIYDGMHCIPTFVETGDVSHAAFSCAVDGGAYECHFVKISDTEVMNYVCWNEYVTQDDLNNISTEDILHEGKNLATTLNNNFGKLDVILKKIGDGEQISVTITDEKMEDWIITEGYWNGSYVSTGA